MATFTQEDKDYLYQIFADKDHEVREGVTTKSGKVRWFVYLERDSIVRHLDGRFFGEWNMDYHSPRDFGKYSETYCRITIRGMHRENNGSNTANKVDDENVGKGAASDAFKRAASSWGIGLYLQDAPQIWTEYDYVDNGRTDYKKREQREKEALQQVYNWLRTLRGGQSIQTGTKQPEGVNEQQWVNDVKKLTHDLYVGSDGKFNEFHQKGSLNKAAEDGLINTDMSPEKAAVMILMHRAEVDYSYDAPKVQEIINSPVGEFIKNGGTISEIWEQVRAHWQAEELAQAS